MKITVEKASQFSGHTGAVYALVAGAESGTFYSAGSEGLAVKWNTGKPDEGEMVAKVGGQIFSMCLVHEAHELLIGTMQGAWHVNDLDKKKEKHFFTRHSDSVFDIKEW